MLQPPESSLKFSIYFSKHPVYTYQCRENQFNVVKALAKGRNEWKAAGQEAPQEIYFRVSSTWSVRWRF